MTRFLQSLTHMRLTWGATANVFAPGTAAAGSASTMTQVGTAVPGILVPTTNVQGAGLVELAPEYLAGGRAQYLWIDSGTARLGIGCEVRPTNGGTYEVHGTADWKLGRVALLSKIVTPFIG